MKKSLFYSSISLLMGFNIAAAEPDFRAYEGLEAKLFASEPMVQDPSAMDIDAKGRVWITEIVNYRKQNGLRPEGDRVVILEDTNGDGKADKSVVFYQDKDFISPHGVCVIDEGKAIVSVGDQVIILTDTDGDLKADKKEVLFSKLGNKQHDHNIHAFVQGALQVVSLLI